MPEDVQMNESEPQPAAPPPAAAPALSTLHRKLPHSILPLPRTLALPLRDPRELAWLTRRLCQI